MKNIGLFGYGTVAQGFLHALKANPQLHARVKRICIKNQEKPRDAEGIPFTTRMEDILEDPEIDIVIELTDDAVAAYSLAKRALSSGRPVITANKKMISNRIGEVALWHQQYTAPLLYEAAVAGSIPILHNLEQFFTHQEVHCLRGILNGSTNYILTAMREQGLDFESALSLAQRLGFAESDPLLDISGHDAMHKLIILAYHAFGVAVTDHSQIRVESITNMEDHFYTLAREQGLKIKSIATASLKQGEVRLKVQPELIAPSDELYGIEHEHNAIVVEGSLSGKQVYSGKGAGSLPTGAAVINDLSLLLYGFRYSRNQKRSVLQKTA